MNLSQAFLSLTFLLLIHRPLLFAGQQSVQTPATPPAPSTSQNPSPAAQDSAAKAAERKKRFEAEKAKLENTSPKPASSDKSAGNNVSPCQSSEYDLSLSPNLVNLVLGETQRFSLFDQAGHKLTAQANWSVSDSSVAELVMEGGTPVLTAKATGTVRVTANVDGRYAEATVNVIAQEDMKPGTIRWSAPAAP